MSLKGIDIQELSINPVTLFSKEWGLLTAGTKEEGFNAMTISWGQIGSLWNVETMPALPQGGPVCTVFSRPQRYTKEFLDKSDFFTVSILPSDDVEIRKKVAWMGANSGRDADKFESTGLTPVFEYGTTYVGEANLVLVCRKIYVGEFVETGFLDQDILDRNYPKRDLHTVYIGSIEHVLEHK